MKKILLTLLWGTCFFVIQAQEESLKLQTEMHIDCQCEHVDKTYIHSNFEFKGKYFISAAWNVDFLSFKNKK